MLSYKCNISIALWSRAENAPLTINRKTNFLVLLRSWVWWMDSTPLFCLLYPRTWTKRVGDLDYKSINFSAKVRYNHVTETAWPRKGARPGPCGPWKLNMQLQVLPDNDTSVIRGPVIKKTGWPRGQWSGANGFAKISLAAEISVRNERNSFWAKSMNQPSWQWAGSPEIAIK